MKKIKLLFIFCSIYFTLTAQEQTQYQTLSFASMLDYEYLSTPAVSFDGKYLIFTAKKDKNYYFYESQMINNRWDTPKELIDITQYLGANSYKNAPIYNYDASEIYFEAENNLQNDIYVSVRTTGGWSEPIILNFNINTLQNEGEPSISADNNALYFVRFENSKDQECGKIFKSKKDLNGNWTTAKPLLEPINTNCERSPRIMADNKTLIFSSNRFDKKFNLFYAKNLYSDIWIIPMQINITTKNDDLYPSIDFEGNLIYWASVKEKKSELVFTVLPSQYKPNKVYFIRGKLNDTNDYPISAKINLLDPTSLHLISSFNNNSKTGEYQIIVEKNSDFIMDFFSSKSSHKQIYYNNNNENNYDKTINETLFFSTTFYLNIYDKDIFEPYNVDFEIKNSKNEIVNTKTTKLTEGKYKIELPIGEKYNIQISSEYTETYILPIDLTGIVILNTFEKDIEIISQKIAYNFKVIDNQDNKGINCDITLVNQSTSKKISSNSKTNENGEVTIYVRKGDIYDVIISPQGYAFYTTTLDVNTEQNVIQVIKLQSLKQDVKIELNNITFETNSAELNIESHKELEKVTKLMLENPQIKVEISAHTDDVGTELHNLNLSQKRAKAVVDYLITKDVPKERLIWAGYGENQPLVPNTNEQNKAINRRVELKILEVTN